MHRWEESEFVHSAYAGRYLFTQPRCTSGVENSHNQQASLINVKVSIKLIAHVYIQFGWGMEMN